MVSVRKRGKVYEYRFEIATVEGTRKWISKSGYPSKAEAFKEGAKAYNDFYYNGNKVQLREKMSYADFLDYWIDTYASFNLHYSTTISYINIIKNHVKPRVGFYKLWQLDTRLLQEFINKIYVEYGFSKNYMASILKVVKGSLKYACYTLNYINTNPAEHVHAPRIDKIGKDPAHIFTQEEIERILDRFKGTHSIYYAFLTAYYTGMRVSEVYGLTWDCVDFEKKTLTINKNIIKKNQYGLPKRKNITKGHSVGVWYYGDCKNPQSKRTISIGDTLVNALKEYKNVKRILKCVFIYVCAIAGSAAILLFILAPFIVDVNAVPALRVLCPTIFLSGLLGVFRGYFQAHKTTIYTSVSQIIEQIFNAVVALLAAYIFIQPYLGVNATKVGSYGAAGSALGTGAGVLVGLIYMIFMYLKKKNTFVEEKDEEASERVDSYQEIFRMIMHIIAPIILATCVYNLVTTIDMYIFYFAQSFHHIDKITYISNYGVYAGKYIVLQNVPVALASAMSTASIPSISSAWALGNVKEAKTHITSGLSVTMLILIPAAVGMAVLSYPIMGVLFPQKATIMTATLLLALGSPAIIFYGLSTLTNGILQALGEVNVPLRNAAFSLVCHIIIIALLHL